MRRLPDTLAPIARSLRENLLPGLLLQATAASLVLAYYQVDALLPLLSALGALKERLAFSFSVPSTILFGGLLPFAFLRATGRLRREDVGREMVFLFLFWGWRGAEVDAFYGLQAALFGSAPEPAIILRKVLFDQLVYNPLWVVPLQTLLFLWKAEGFSALRVREALRRQNLFLRALPVLLSTWMLWIPGVAIIYSLPVPLQLPLCNVLTCFWCLLLTSMSQRTSPRPSAEAEPGLA